MLATWNRIVLANLLWFVLLPMPLDAAAAQIPDRQERLEGYGSVRFGMTHAEMFAASAAAQAEYADYLSMIEAWTYEAAKENTPEITQAEYEEQRGHALSEEVLDKQKRFYIDYPDTVSIQSIDFRPSYEFDQNDRLTEIELMHSDIKTNVSSCRKLVVKVRSLVEAKYGRPDTGTRGVFTFKDYSSIAVEHLAMKNVCIVTVKYRAPGGKGSF